MGRLPTPRRMHNLLLVGTLTLWVGTVQAGPHMYEPMAESVRNALSAAISDRPPLHNSLQDEAYLSWRQAMSQRLAGWTKNEHHRFDLLDAVYYEATRAGLDPQLVLGLIEVESAFRKYAVSHAGARGLMQIMPFWIDVIGQPDDNLFHLRTNLRYGCTILRHYIDIEKGNLFRALGRYNGSLGKAAYPEKVRAAWLNNWAAPPQPETQIAQKD